MKTNNLSIAIVPGSFDPITYGHVELVRQAKMRYDKVYLAVMINSAKSYCFNLEQRTEIARAAVADMEGVEVIASEGMLWQLAEKLHATGIVKGYRNEADLQYEKEMAAFNEAHNPNAKTLLLPSSDGLQHISSTEVRRRLDAGESIEDIVPPTAVACIRRILGQ